MPKIKDRYDSEDDVPTEYAALFTEQTDGWRLTEVEGIKTSTDTAKLTESLNKERKVSKGLKAKLKVWDGMDATEIHARLDRIDALEAAAGGKLDDAKIGELVAAKLAAELKIQTNPLQRQIKDLTTERDTLLTENGALTKTERTRQREDTLRPILTDLKVSPEYHGDALMRAERELERGEDGAYHTADGRDVKGWAEDLVSARSAWVPGAVGGGARGGGSGGALNGNNPFDTKNPNYTAQLQMNAENPEKAQRMAAAAGVSVPGT